MKKGAKHHDKLKDLRRIEGQIRGVQNMITDERYCIDILILVQAVSEALRRVEKKILKDHINSCVNASFFGKSEEDKQEKLKEIMDLLEGYRR